MRGLSENLQCKNPSFFTKWCDLLDLSYGRKLLDMLYIDPRGVRGGIALIFFWKSVFEKHPSDGGGQDNIEMLKVQIICWAAILITTLHRYHPILVVIVKFILVCNLVILLLPKYFFVNNQNASHPGQWPTDWNTIEHTISRLTLEALPWGSHR